MAARRKKLGRVDDRPAGDAALLRGRVRRQVDRGGDEVRVADCGAAAPNYYRSAVARQEQCCGGLADPAAKEACLAQVLRVDDESVELSPVNQETFQCVDRHFRCEPTTGRATPESSQAQLDCLNDLGSTPQ
jgi:hypothetical protein